MLYRTYRKNKTFKGKGRVNKEERKKALEEIRAIADQGAKAETEFKKNTEEFLSFFLPTWDHIEALDPDKFLILGSRGTGKTYLFGSLAQKEIQQNLVSFFCKHHPWLKQAIFIVGFGQIPGIEQYTFPASDILDKIAVDFKNEIHEWRLFWLGLLLGCILQTDSLKINSHIDAILPEVLKKKAKNTTQPSEWLPLVAQYLEKIYLFLDKLDQYFTKQDRWLLIIYDALDKLTSSYHYLAAPIKALLSFWLGNWSRWSRIRGKIFLRTDLFRPEFLSFPDASKLKTHEVELSWSPLHLYFLVFKRMVNAGKVVRELLKTLGVLYEKKHPILGWLPKPNEDGFKKIIKEIIGPYMGSGPKKGHTYNWIPNHLQDANGVVMPRPMLNLFHFAAKGRLERGLEKLKNNKLLLPEDLSGALKEVSEHRIKELSEEFQWVNFLKPYFQGLSMPVEEQVLLDKIGVALKTKKDEIIWPSSDPETILNLLMEIGILEERTDGRLNVPDIYLYGFRMKRKGGPRRPKQTYQQRELFLISKDA